MAYSEDLLGGFVPVEYSEGVFVLRTRTHPIGLGILEAHAVQECLVTKLPSLLRLTSYLRS